MKPKLKETNTPMPKTKKIDDISAIRNVKDRFMNNSDLLLST